MNKKKIKIASHSCLLTSGEALIPIIKYCLERGGKFRSKHSSTENPFTEERHGLVCRLLGPTTVKDISDAFNLPDNIELNSPNLDCLRDTYDNTLICLTSFEEHGKYNAISRERKIKSAALLAEANKKRDANNAR